MQEKIVSVIVPVFRAEKYLSRCLNSICAQTYCNLEIILIDDGSPDNSGIICDDYAAKDNRIRVIHKQNAGVSAARNDGLDVATGEFITFVDSDDYIAPEMYGTLVRMIESENADIAICGFAKERTPGKFESYWKEGISLTLSLQEQLECLLTNKYYCCSCGEMLFRSNVISEIRFDTTKKHNEDLLFIYEVMKSTRKAVYTSEPFYYYCNNQESATNTKFSESKMAIIDVNEFIFQDIEKNFPALSMVSMREFMRNNITCAMEMARCSYSDHTAIARVRKNIREHLGKYLCTDASVGYKVCAALASINWTVFKSYIKLRG